MVEWLILLPLGWQNCAEIIKYRYQSEVVMVMFEIDKKSFGEFISMLRKEKSMTQKDLASRLLVSDKAVSKWETGVSPTKGY